MRSYFIRHTKRIAVIDRDVDRVFNHDKVAIHFPGKVKEGSESIDPSDYEKKGDRRAIRRFAEVNRDGGYIWAEYYTSGYVKIGRIRPHSFEILESTWSRNTRTHKKGDRTKLKTLQMENVTIVKLYEAMSLRAGRPRQGTIVRWKAVGTRLEHLVEKKPLPRSWKTLFPEQQETICAEYLRSPDFAECPELGFLLLPVGRTLKDVDIIGCTEKRREIFAQVTYYPRNHPTCKRKIKNLKRYRRRMAHLVFFCDCNDVIEEDGVLFIPTEKVFKWLRKKRTYIEALYAI